MQLAMFRPVDWMGGYSFSMAERCWFGEAVVCAVDADVTVSPAW